MDVDAKYGYGWMDESKCEGVRDRQFKKMIISLFRQRDLFHIQIVKKTIFT
jgi:hypothetical protein